MTLFCGNGYVGGRRIRVVLLVRPHMSALVAPVVIDIGHVAGALKQPPRGVVAPWTDSRRHGRLDLISAKGPGTFTEPKI